MPANEDVQSNYARMKKRIRSGSVDLAVLGLGYAVERATLNDLLTRMTDITLAVSLLAYRPVIDPDEGLARTVAWYRGRTSINQ